mmetsp:Transcript_19385/g.34534  ORF Transcript_19385/g.34534 Transcript_19385/m.34534 type:complete len:225 (-) Transcript_19385:405-1079(-)
MTCERSSNKSWDPAGAAGSTCVNARCSRRKCDEGIYLRSGEALRFPYPGRFSLESSMLPPSKMSGTCGTTALSDRFLKNPDLGEAFKRGPGVFLSETSLSRDKLDPKVKKFVCEVSEPPGDVLSRSFGAEDCLFILCLGIVSKRAIIAIGPLLIAGVKLPLPSSPSLCIPLGPSVASSRCRAFLVLSSEGPDGGVGTNTSWVPPLSATSILVAFTVVSFKRTWY